MNVPAGIRVRVGYPRLLRLLLMRNVAAIAIGRRIWIARELREPEMERLLRHELVHVRQMARCGIVRFFCRYAAEYVRNRLRGLSHDAAYQAISFEAEAFTEEEAS
jgi:hypothetical protein